ncbi:MAG: 50S ribosomal protein L23 [Candidatus Nanoarchaeia archaeon]
MENKEKAKLKGKIKRELVKPVSKKSKTTQNKEKIGYEDILDTKAVITEKAVMLIESQNVLTFKFGMNASKKQIKKEIEGLFDVKVDKIRVLNRNSKKYAYVKLNSKNPAIDVATKLGMI